MIYYIIWLASAVRSFLEYELKYIESLPEPVDDVLLQRRSSPPLRLKNRMSGYTVQIGIGTPPQYIDLLLDTTSSASLIMSESAIIDQPDSLQRKEFFKERDSYTFRTIPKTFAALFNDDTYFNGTWFEDKVRLDNTTCADLKLCLIRYSDLGLRSQEDFLGGLLGLGLRSTLSDTEGYCAANTGCRPSSSILQELKHSGLITYSAYSIWLNAYYRAMGLLLFGAVDHSLIASDMYRFPIVPFIEPRLSFFSIKMDGLYLVSPDNWQQLWAETSISILFDTGRSITSLPQSLAEPFFTALGCSEINGTWYVECDKIRQGGGVGINFSGVEFVFPFSDVAIMSSQDHRYCIPGIVAGDHPILGANFLRTLYVVYDMHNMELGIAIANTEAISEANRSAITSSLPGTSAPNYMSSQVKVKFKLHSIRPIATTGPKVDSDGNIRLGSVNKRGIPPYHVV